MQIRLKEDLTRDEALMLLEVANAEVASLHQQMEAAQKIIDQQAAAIAERDARLNQVELQLESICAGGVSGRRITDPGALEALQACEQAYHRMIVDGTPQDCQAHDKARARFWRVFGGEQ